MISRSEDASIIFECFHASMSQLQVSHYLPHNINRDYAGYTLPSIWMTHNGKTFLICKIKNFAAALFEL